MLKQARAQVGIEVLPRDAHLTLRIAAFFFLTALAALLLALPYAEIG